MRFAESVARSRCNFLHQAKLARLLWKHLVFRAKICESQQSLFLSSSKAESKMVVVVTIEKFLGDFLFVISLVCHKICHEARDVGTVLISYYAETLSDGLSIGDFGPD